MLLRKLFFIGVFCFTALLASQNKVEDIVIEGAHRLEKGTIRSYMKIKVGDEISQRQIDLSLKSLFRTGLFKDVVIQLKGKKLFVKVIENPIINRISFEGNSKIEDKTLKEEVQLRPRVVFSKTKVQEDLERILTLYRRQGRYAATVEPKIIKRDQNRVDLIFEIQEGASTQVRRINFIGNSKFSDRQLKGAIATKEWAWWRFFSSEHVYDPEKLEYDKELLRQYYLDRGYADFNIISATAELSLNKEDFYLTFVIEEGERYKIGKIAVKSALPNVNTKELEKMIQLEDEWYSQDEVESSVTSLTDYIGTKGFAFVNVVPQVKRDAQKRTINITFEIQEGPKVFIRKINLKGNIRTRDYVIRREMQLAEGDAYNKSKIKDSYKRIRNLGFFKNVSIDEKQTNQSDEADINVEVEEQSTGSLQFSAGYSTADGLLGEVAIEEQNFKGTGNSIQFRGTMATTRSALSAGIVQPYFLDKNLTMGIQGFISKDNKRSESNYDERLIGFSNWYGYNLAKHLTQKISYTLEDSDIRNVKSDASRVTREQQGHSTVSAIGQLLTYDKTDYALDPSSGYVLKLANTFAGVGGSIRYLNNVASAINYISFYNNWVWAFQVRGGKIFTLGKRSRIADRFQLGGESFSGFRNAGVGPRDITSKDKEALGGVNFYTVSTEVGIPVGNKEDMGLKFHLFAHAGSLWDARRKADYVWDDRKMRAAAGIGLSWLSPFGPLRFDFSQPLRKGEHDKTQRFLFSMRTGM